MRCETIYQQATCYYKSVISYLYTLLLSTIIQNLQRLLRNYENDTQFNITVQKLKSKSGSVQSAHITTVYTAQLCYRRLSVKCNTSMQV